MSAFQLMFALDGYAAAHDPKAGKALSNDEADDLWDWMNRPVAGSA